MKYALILSGGMAKGAYQIGALRAIAEYISPDQFSHISCASVGVLNAIPFSAGRVDEAESRWLSINHTSSKLFASAVYKSGFMQDCLQALSKSTPKCEKLYFPLLNWKSREVIYPNYLTISPAEREQYLRAAIACPPFSWGVRIGTKSYLDGALVDNIPIRPLLDAALDFAICIYFDQYNYAFESDIFDKRIIKIPFGEEGKILSTSLWFTEEGTKEMIQRGYQKAKGILDFVFSDGIDDRDAIIEHIRELNRLNIGNHFRLTEDAVINNANKIFRCFSKRKMLE